VVELDREVRFEVELPGVPRDRVLVTVSGDYLVVRGERPYTRPQNVPIRHQERSFGSFQRAIALPPRARRDGIEATLRDGVLVIAVPTDGTGQDGAEVPVAIK
jgi:HSP20 family protein